MQQSITDFWNWFKERNEAFLNINSDTLDEQERDDLLNEMEEHLHTYCDCLYFEIGGWPGEDQELIITAEGDTGFFTHVEELVNNAPDIDKWTIIAFMQPVSLESDPYICEFEDVELKANDIWFLPMDSKSNPKSIGIRVCLPNYKDVKDSKWLQPAVFKVLDTVLGEKAFALDIDYVDIGPLPDNPEEQGMIELKEIAAFIRWKKKKLERL
jgi:hypothetical protein